MEAKLIITDEVNVKITGLELRDRKRLSDTFKFEIPGARYQPSVRLGRWDGKVSFFQLGGSTYINLLPEILPMLEQMGYDVILEDQRQYRTQFEFTTFHEDTFSHVLWPVGHPAAGQPIKFRDYQVEIINNFLQNPQSVQEIATGSGKCLAKETEVNISLDEESDFYKFLQNVLNKNQFLGEKTLRVPIGILIDAMAEFKNLTLSDSIEQPVADLSVNIETPTGFQRINYVIRKDNLPGRRFVFSDNTALSCADGHVLFDRGLEKGAINFCIADLVDTAKQPKKIIGISNIENDSYYDLSIDYPHKYIDSNGIIHHNTILSAALSKSVENYGRSIVIVPNKSLVTQTEADYRNMGLDVGVYYGDKKEFGKTHTICTWQSLDVLLKSTQNGQAETTIGEFIEGVVLIMVDEVHAAKATALKHLLTGVFAHVPIRWGLTGTIPKEKSEQLSIFCSLGSVVGKLSANELQEAGHLAQCHVNIVQLVDHGEYKEYQTELKYLTENLSRVDYIADLINKIKDTGNTLVLVDRIASGKLMAERLPNAVFVSGSTKATDRKDEYDAIATNDGRIIIATYGVAAVGINIPRIFNLVLLEPGKSFTRVIQSIGRGIRKAEDKDFVNIYDITSTCKFSKRHLTKRKAYYTEANYPFSMEKVNWQTDSSKK